LEVHVKTCFIIIQSGIEHVVIVFLIVYFLFPSTIFSYMLYVIQSGIEHVIVFVIVHFLLL